MKFFLTGGTGFVGTYLAKQLAQQGHELTILSRRAQSSSEPHRRYVQGDPTVPGPWQQQVPEHDVIINLAGASIFVRWTPENKKTIRDSRVLTTQHLVAALAAAPARQTKVLLSTSAIGYYGDRGDEELTEASPPGNDFLARVAQEWEAAALAAQDLGVRTVITRFGLVLGRGGGLLGSMVPLFKSFVGGPVGSGRQWLSWIDQSDQLRAFLFVLEHPELTGVINFCSPNPVRNAEFAEALGRVLNRPSFLSAPAFLVKAALGEFAPVVLGGQKVLPQKLLAAGFTFEYPTITAALRHQLLEQD
ncbi:MAG: TIGR01777 family oxidoreductase [Desulfobacca sp.]|uniref:TIGR01777 family oxidoreductase n=1 Tax=Desulfobacca sp. TaxID=2067990 RepID=UPI00404AE044